jgi:hypothetical protein
MYVLIVCRIITYCRRLKYIYICYSFIILVTRCTSTAAIWTSGSSYSRNSTGTYSYCNNRYCMSLHTSAALHYACLHRYLFSVCIYGIAKCVHWHSIRFPVVDCQVRLSRSHRRSISDIRQHAALLHIPVLIIEIVAKEDMCYCDSIYARLSFLPQVPLLCAY